MSIALYVDAAAQLALARRLDNLAFNLANANTPGFLADGLKFDSVLSTTGGSNVAFPDAGTDFISLAHGGALRTGNTLDVAVRGDGWLAISTPEGVAYTRDGRMQIDSNGEIRTLTGYPVLDAAGAPLVVDPAGGDISIATDGAIVQRGKQVGALGMFVMDPGARITRHDNSAVLSDREAIPVTNFSTTGLMQGYVEQANVNPLSEISRLIEIQRLFDHIAACMTMSDTSQQEAIRVLGGQS
ncbi:MAG TPA: flagellar basal-body rod protein FlgF [Rhodoblastus sp.]|nr:flagellar basal-body rod protein FlgF [Rhodoblastus sp.]